MLPVLINSIPDAGRRGDPLASRDTRYCKAAGDGAWFCRRRLSMAQRQRRGMLGLLAGRHRAFHVNADIADAVLRYVNATGDVAFEREIGVEILIETARLWCH